MYIYITINYNTCKNLYKLIDKTNAKFKQSSETTNITGERVCLRSQPRYKCKTEKLIEMTKICKQKKIFFALPLRNTKYITFWYQLDGSTL